MKAIRHAWQDEADHPGYQRIGQSTSSCPATRGLQVQDLDKPAIIRIIDIISTTHIIAIIFIIGIIYILGQGLHFGDAIIRIMNINSIIHIINIGIIGIICITFSAWVSVLNPINQKMWSIK